MHKNGKRHLKLTIIILTQTRVFMILWGARLLIKSNSFCLSDHKLNECRTALSYKQGNVRDGRHGPVIWVDFKTFYHNSSFTSHNRRTYIYTNTNLIRCSKTHNYICFLFKQCKSCAVWYGLTASRDLRSTMCWKCILQHKLLGSLRYLSYILVTLQRTTIDCSQSGTLSPQPWLTPL